MQYKCKNCGGNVLFDPDSQKMVCAQCSSENSQDIISGNLESCPNCGAPLEITDKTTSSKCNYCGSYLIFDNHLQNDFLPNLVLPFKISKNKVRDLINENFGKRISVPDNFLNYKSLEKIEGVYVPFYLYDYLSHCTLEAVGIKDRSWRQGDYIVTEHRHYQISRDLDIPFHKVPVDGSKVLDDAKMSLVEPYDYDQLLSFDTQFLSGFFSDQADFEKGDLETLAQEKARDFAKIILNRSVSGYTRIVKNREEIDCANIDSYYALMPMWIYRYSFMEKEYDIFINGQNGKIIGEIPIDKKKVFIYFSLFFIVLALIIGLGLSLAGAL